MEGKKALKRFCSCALVATRAVRKYVLFALGAGPVAGFDGDGPALGFICTRSGIIQAGAGRPAGEACNLRGKVVPLARRAGPVAVSHVSLGLVGRDKGLAGMEQRRA